MVEGNEGSKKDGMYFDLTVEIWENGQVRRVVEHGQCQDMNVDINGISEPSTLVFPDFEEVPSYDIHLCRCW